MRTRITIAATLLLASLAAQASGAPSPYRLAEEPAWVMVAEDAPLTRATRAVEAGNADFLLVDYQVRLTAVQSRYARFAELLVNQDAVDRAAQISIEINPEHEQVLLHSVRVFRDGRVIDKLADARRSLLNREQDMEQGLINGRVTLHLLLQDVRVGDVLDYAFTTNRTDPISERGYYEWFSTQWASPVRHLRLRILHRHDRPLYIKDQGAMPQPRQRELGEWRETTWEARDIAALENESARPGWDFRYPRIEFSEFANWAAVRDWALPLFELDARRNAAVEDLVKELGAEPDEATRILKALRFVQDDIRYTGLEIGVGAWRPTQPGTVLARRYGDCKDKTLLLVTLLRRLGLDASPAMVHSSMGRGLRDRLPSPGVFDHVITRVRWKDRDYWLDATTSGQGGNLDTLVQSDYGPALLIAPGPGELVDMPRATGSRPTSQVIETFDFRKGTANTAVLKVHTLHRDAQADGMRARLQTNTATKLGQDYLDYYRKSYSGIRMIEPLRVSDDRAGNQVTLDESYEIDAPFAEKADGKREFVLEAYLITEQSANPDQTVRTSPLARRFPLNVRHEIVAYLPGDWTINAEDVKISDPAFEYRSSLQFQRGKLEITHELRNKSDHVPASRLGEFLKKLKTTRDGAYYTLEDNQHGAAVAVPSGPSFVMIITLAMGLACGVAAGLWLRKTKWRLPAADPGAPEGLSGWLVLVLFGLGITPPILVYQIYTFFRDFGAAAQFQSLADAVQITLLMEFLLIYMLLVLVVFSLWFAFTRHRSFPFAFVAAQVLAVLVLGSDAAVLAAMGDAGSGQQTLASTKLATRLFAASIWIMYAMVSQRVRATFVEPGDVIYKPRDVPGELSAPPA